MNTNLIKFHEENIETSKGSGSISTPTFDVDVMIEPNNSDNPMAPTHRVFARSPRGKLVECGDVWKKENKETGEPYFTLSIRDWPSRYDSTRSRSSVVLGALGYTIPGQTIKSSACRNLSMYLNN